MTPMQVRRRTIERWNSWTRKCSNSQTVLAVSTFTQKDLNTKKYYLVPDSKKRGSLLWTHIQKSLMETDSHWMLYLVMNAFNILLWFFVMNSLRLSKYFISLRYCTLHDTYAKIRHFRFSTHVLLHLDFYSSRDKTTRHAFYLPPNP